MRVMRKIRTMALAAGAGAAAAYFLDPDNGPDRRRRIAGALDEARRSLEEARGSGGGSASADGPAGAGAVNEGLPTTDLVSDVLADADADLPGAPAPDPRLAEARSAAPAPG
ncbi:hypothetical protein [Dermatobacter hominis]|uniref:hypothetical protein n=1 Tax=Dermatobacter hominis TaxID=2884263 RepID=UPI001D100E09|nr:hypothetical protein [Dermatobacter hominis]UDY37473.1 hypothetical protein LH044_07995 [Dermatobacter hominis]